MFSSNTSQVADDKLYSEDVFSTFLYTGNGSAQTITNGIDLAGKGGLVWIKPRNLAADHILEDTARGTTKFLASNLSDAQATDPQSITAFNSTGFTLGTSSNVNYNPYTYASWTFRKAPKFFDVVTYTGDGTSNRSIAHSLGVAPGMIAVKKTSSTGAWIVYHRSLALNGSFPNYLVLNSTAAQDGGSSGVWASAPTSTHFSVGSDGNMNANGDTYVAYLYAHDATSDGIIQCGSFTTNANGYASINLGWEPQWIIYKNRNSASNWGINDSMRGMTAATTTSSSGNYTQRLFPDLSSSENQSNNFICNTTSTGFTFHTNFTNATFIYIAIRRGPMRTPTSGTSVFGVNTATQAINSSTRPPAVSFITDMAMYRGRSGVLDWAEVDRLRGPNWLVTNYVGAEASGINAKFDTMTGWYPDVNPWEPSGSYLFYNFRRAPSFFDEVCYTGTGVARTVNHNLGVAPELMIVKKRNGIDSWYTYNATIGAGNALALNTTLASFSSAASWNNTAPTSTVFTVNTEGAVNGSGNTYVAYLFASCPGVSKVGSYTGNGSSQTINCGFAAGARFVMIKRTDSTGDWYVWDTARGIVAGNDPHLSLNTTAAEVTTDDSIDTDSSGFVVNQVAATNINVSSATYIYLAVA